MILAGFLILSCFEPASVSSASVGVNSLEMENHLLSNKLHKLEEELYETKNFIKLMYMAVSLAFNYNLIITIHLVPHSQQGQF